MDVSDGGNLPRGGVTYCDPCENEGCHFLAEGFCITCNDYLCSGCLKIHRRPVLWRYHELCNKQKMPKMKLMERVKEECIEPCPQHRNKILEYFCNTHDTLACSLCVFRKHRHCEKVDFIPDVAESISGSEELRELNKNFACLLKDIEKNKTLTEKSLPVVDEIQRKAVSQIVKLKVGICDFLDKLLKDTIFISQFDRANLNSCLNSFTLFGKSVKTRATILEKKQKERKMSQLFVDIKLSKLALNRLRSEVEKTKENYTMQQYEVSIDDSTVKEIQKCLEKIWKINKSVGFPDTEEEADIAVKDNGSTVESDDETYTILDDELIDDKSKLKKAEGKQHEVTPHNMTDFGMSAEINKLSETDKDIEKPIEDHHNLKSPEEIVQYSRDFLLKMQTCVQALHKPVGILDVPNIVFDEPQDFYVRWVKAGTDGDAVYFRPGAPLKASSTTSQHIDQAVNDKSKLSTKKKKKLYSLIAESVDDHSIFEWIESSMTKAQESGTYFVNTLINSVCRSSCMQDGDNGWLFKPEKFVERKELLRKFVGRKTDLELHALKAVRSFTQIYRVPQELQKEVYGAVLAAGIVSEDKFAEFMKENTIEVQVKKCSFSKVKRELHTLIRKEMKHNQSIIDWIECNVDKSCKEGTSFVRYLTTSVCWNSTENDDEGNAVFHPEKINERKDLLLKYIDQKLDLELAALFAVQNYIEAGKHPPGTLRDAFVVLYESGIISKDAFFKWDTSAEKSEAREESLKQTIPFFTSLLTQDNHQ